MKAKLTKVMAMASLAAFLTVGIGANVATTACALNLLMTKPLS